MSGHPRLRRMLLAAFSVLVSFGSLAGFSNIKAQDFPGSITIVVGFAPGGGEEGQVSAGRSAAARLQPQPGYDQTARLYARHLGHFLPGSVSVSVRHLPGAGSMKAAAYLAREAAVDGSVLGVVSGEALIAAEVARDGGAGYRISDFAFIGARAASEYVCAADAKAYPEAYDGPDEIAFAATAPGRRPHIHAAIFKALTRAPMRIVDGYRDANEMMLALRRGEVAGLCGLAFETVRAAAGPALANGSLRPLLRMSPDFAERLSAVPRAHELARQKGWPEAEVEALDVMAQEGALAWTLMAPARLPTPLLQGFRKAFAAMQTDRDYLREAQRRNLEISAISAERIEKAAQRFAAADANVRAAIAKLTGLP